MLRYAVAGSVFACLLVGCGQQANDVRLSMALNELRQECFGDDTYDCRNKTIDYNIKVLDLTDFKSDAAKEGITKLFGDKGWSLYKDVADNFVAEGKDAMDSMRPNIFARLFFGGDRPPSPVGRVMDFDGEDMVRALHEIERRFAARAKKEGMQPDKDAVKAYQLSAASRDGVTVAPEQPAQVNTQAVKPTPAPLAMPELVAKPAYQAPEPTVPKDTSLDAAVTAYIATMDTDGGTEYTEGRQNLKVDLNGDGVMDAAVIFTIEGAGGAQNGYQTLEGFIHEGNQWKALPGSIVMSGAVQSLANGGVNAVIVETLTRGPDDPDCCPSVQSRQKYFWSGEKFVEMPLKPKS